MAQPSTISIKILDVVETTATIEWTIDGEVSVRSHLLPTNDKGKSLTLPQLREWLKKSAKTLAVEKENKKDKENNFKNKKGLEMSFIIDDIYED